jgi:membrane protease YdiL (CAAX protease family)
MDDFDQAVPTFGEMIAVVVLCFGWFILNSLQAATNGFPAGDAFNDASSLALVIWEVAVGALALFILVMRGHRISELLPSPTWRGSLHGALLFLTAAAAAGFVINAFSQDYLSAQPITEMAAAKKVSVEMVLLLSVVNGFYEETFLVGYLIRFLRRSGPTFALGVSLLVRILYHLYQGPVGALSVLVFGFILSAYYIRTANLWPVVLAHILADAYALL